MKMVGQEIQNQDHHVGVNIYPVSEDLRHITNAHKISSLNCTNTGVATSITFIHIMFKVVQLYLSYA